MKNKAFYKNVQNANNLNCQNIIMDWTRFKCIFYSVGILFTKMGFKEILDGFIRFSSVFLIS